MKVLPAGVRGDYPYIPQAQGEVKLSISMQAPVTPAPTLTPEPTATPSATPSAAPSVSPTTTPDAPEK